MRRLRAVHEANRDGAEQREGTNDTLARTPNLGNDESEQSTALHSTTHTAQPKVHNTSTNPASAF
jgi:hypothetical protein